MTEFEETLCLTFCHFNSKTLDYWSLLVLVTVLFYFFMQIKIFGSDELVFEVTLWSCVGNFSFMIL